MDSKARKKNAWHLPEAGQPATDEYLAAVTIGERQPHDDCIRLVDYDASWPEMFARAAARVRAALSEKVLSIDHVGSTAVPGLAAKPIIDMVLVVHDSADEAAYVPSLEAQGFVLRAREPDWFEHRFMVLASGEQTWQLHIFSAGCEEVDRMVAFRDWLREHDADRVLYENTKRALAARVWRDVQNYADAKSEVVRQILERARGGAAEHPPTD